jgi:large subunit ribosomal protein L16
VKPGRVLFEISYPEAKVAEQALARAAQKLPIKTRFIHRGEGI